MAHLEPGIYCIKSLFRENGVLTLDKKNEERVVIADNESTWRLVSVPHIGPERTAFNIVRYNPIGGIEDLALEVEVSTPRANVYARQWRKDDDHQKWLVIPITGTASDDGSHYHITSCFDNSGLLMAVNPIQPMIFPPPSPNIITEDRNPDKTEQHWHFKRVLVE